jgi:hypothetical protein
MISWDDPSHIYVYFGNIDEPFKALMVKEGWHYLCEITFAETRLAIFRRKA